MECKANLGIVMLTLIIFLSSTIVLAESEPEELGYSLDWKIKDLSENVYRQPKYGDTMVVYRTLITVYDQATPVTFTIKDPAGETIVVGQETPTCIDKQCSAEWEFVVAGPHWKYTGQYKIMVCDIDGYCIGEYFPLVIGPESLRKQVDEDLMPEDNITAKLQAENEKLKQEVTSLKSQLVQFQKRIDDLNEIIMMQIEVIYQWVITK